jgi:hypothetical protein
MDKYCLTRQFQIDSSTLRGFIKSSEIEGDDYKIIIYVERFILEYGKKATKDHVAALKATKGKIRQEIILDLLQTRKTLEELVIYLK